MEHQQSRLQEWWLSLFRHFPNWIVFLVLSCIALPIRAWFPVTHAYILTGSNMEPTLHAQDRVWSDERLPLRSLHRSEIVLFYLPTEGQSDNNQPTVEPSFGVETREFNRPFEGGKLIKRIVGLPGEIVEISEGKVSINGHPLQESYSTIPPNYTMKPYRVPANHYFVLGDNRAASYDSHLYGAVHQELLIGRVWYQLWPPTCVRLFSPQTSTCNAQVAGRKS